METVKHKPSAQIVKLPPRKPAMSGALQLDRSYLSYQNHIFGYAQKIRQSHDTDEIIRILDEALKETRNLHTPDELAIARKQVADAERKIMTLKAELEEVSSLLREDPLTSALNRRGLDEGYAREAARSDRRGTSLCLALIDLDNFKKLNDTHGHPAGDAALIEVTRTARATLRPNDSIARIGGEEFVLLLPDTDLESAIAATNRLAAKLNTMQMRFDGAAVIISFSAGIALRNGGEPLHGMLSRVDAALYAAKHAGKNRTEVAPQ